MITKLKLKQFVLTNAILTLLLSGCSLLGPELGSQTGIKAKKLAEILGNWREDYSSCDKLREAEDALFLLEEIDWVGKNLSEILELLGPPNEYAPVKYYISDENRDGAWPVMKYYYELPCSEGVPMPERQNRCWIEFLLDPENQECLLVNLSCT